MYQHKGNGDKLLPFAVGLAMVGLWLWATNPAQQRKPLPPGAASDIPPLIYTIRLPKTTKRNAERTLQFFDQLLLNFPNLLLRIYADETGVDWQIVDNYAKFEPIILERIIRSAYPDAEISTQVYEVGEVAAPFYRYISYYDQPNMFVAPLSYLTDFRQSDPLSSLAEAMSDLKTGERVIYTLVLLGAVKAGVYDEGQKLITQSTIHPLQYLSRRGIGDALQKALAGADRAEKFVARDQRIFEEKLRQPLYEAMLLIQAESPDPTRLVSILIGMDSQMAQFSRQPYNALGFVQRTIEDYVQTVETAEQDQQTDSIALHQRIVTHTISSKTCPPILILEPRELAALWHLPHDHFGATQIKWLRANAVTMPHSLIRQQEGVYIGTARFKGRDESIQLSDEDRRTHINIIGKTGMGKSTLLHHLIHQDIERGAGVAVLDPHGTLIKAILQTSIPPEREDDVVILDVGDTNHPPPINPMRGIQSQAGMGRIMNVFARLFDGVEQYARLSRYLQGAIGLLQADEQPTMRDLSKVFNDEAYRHQLLANTDSPFVEEVWEHYEAVSEAQQRQIYDPIFSRIAPFYGNPTLYPILCHPDALDLRGYIQDKKIILISLAISEDLVSEQERNLIGALLVSLLQMSGMGEVSEPFYVYVDEVQKFVTTSLDVVLSEARKFGLALTIANQFLGQLEGKTLEAVMGNAGTSIAFRCSPSDARALGPHMRPEFSAETLVDIDRFQAATKMQVKGATQPAFTLFTPSPLDRPDDYLERERRIRARAIDQYTPRSREQILTWLAARYPRRGRVVDEGVQDYDQLTSDDDSV
jgi:hypothetical protein